MERRKKRFKNFLISLQVGWFLAFRQVKRSSVATTLLIIFVMTLTFLNLVVVRGVLVGLLQGSTDVYKSRFAGDIIITNLPKKNYIENSPSIIEIAGNLPWVDKLTYRYVEGASAEANYKTRIDFTEEPDTTAGSVVGINPALEDAATHISNTVVEGRYLTDNDAEGILIGANMLKKYLDIEAPTLTFL